MKNIMKSMSVFFIIAFAGSLAIAGENAEKVVTAKDCMPWEDFTDGTCVDKPGVFRPEDKGYVPPSHLRCFAECKCGKTQQPAGPKCAPCQYVGIVCMSR